MTEPEVATKAPESDAAEDQTKEQAMESLIPGDTPAQSGPSMGLGVCWSSLEHVGSLLIV